MVCVGECDGLMLMCLCVCVFQMADIHNAIVSFENALKLVSDIILTELVVLLFLLKGF